MRHCQEFAVVYMLQSGFSNAAPEVINIMDALKESMQAKGRAKLRDAVRRRMGKPEKEERAAQKSGGTCHGRSQSRSDCLDSDRVLDDLKNVVSTTYSTSLMRHLIAPSANRRCSIIRIARPNSGRPQRIK